jgi:hypothetical protein
MRSSGSSNPSDIPMLRRVFKVVTSLQLTVVLLALSVILVFVGTVAQADEGLYQAQARYFKHWFVNGFTFFGYRVALPLPGGYLLGTLLLINLVAAHIKRFQWSWKKSGIHLTHSCIILLLAGQLVTDLLSRETQLHFAEGEKKSYSESASNYELAFVSDAADGLQDVVAIPQQLLVDGGSLTHPGLPFTVRVRNIWRNSEPSFRAPMQQNGPPLTTNGIATSFDFRAAAEVKTMEEKNVPTAVVEIVEPNGATSSWVASGWAGDAVMVDAVRRSFRRSMGDQMASTIGGRLAQPQTFVSGGKEFSLVMRPERTYTPFSLTLLKATHTVYPGTDIPKDFRSRVRLENPQAGENRELEIYMNTPLRYGGLTFYQYQMSANEMTVNAGLTPSSTLQVVRNPGWLTPYAGCAMVGGGLVIQFMIHLVSFVSRRKT